MRTLAGISAIAFILSTMIIAAVANAASSDDILGVWNNEEKDAKIEIIKCGEKFCGKIVSLNEPNYPVNSKEGLPGTPKTDHHNPEAANRTKPIIGLQIVSDFIYAGAGAWKDGTVYDPKNGKTYSGKLTLISPTTLNLRGFVGIPLFGRTATWTK